MRQVEVGTEVDEYGQDGGTLKVMAMVDFRYDGGDTVEKMLNLEEERARRRPEDMRR